MSPGHCWKTRWDYRICSSAWISKQVCNPFVEETTQFLFQPLAIKYMNMFRVLFPPFFFFKMLLVHASVSQKEKKRKSDHWKRFSGISLDRNDWAKPNNGNQDNLEIDLGTIIINTCTHERGAVHSVGATAGMSATNMEQMVGEPCSTCEEQTVTLQRSAGKIIIKEKSNKAPAARRR